jgi:WS/DGAT/MGAT family acyltransferase
VHAAGSLATTPLRAARATGDVARAAVRIARVLATEDRGGVVLPFVGPATRLNGSLVPGRTFAYTSVSLADVKAVKAAVGVTVNDVVMALCGGAVRNHLEECGELPARSLTASVPVSVAASGGAAGILGNTQSVFGATLATNVADPVERLRRIHASTRAAKSVHRALGTTTPLHLADVLPPGLFGAFIRGWTATGLASRMVPPFNLVVSNLVGPSITLYSAGARVVAFHVLGPVIEAVSLNITVLSYVDSIDVAIVASPNLVADAWPIADRIPGALAELKGAAVPA